ARVPVAADTQEVRLQETDDALADGDRAVLVKGAVIAEGRQVELQRLRFDDPVTRHVIDDEMREIRLSGDRAERGELRRGEADDVRGIRMRIRHSFELGLVR